MLTAMDSCYGLFRPHQLGTASKTGTLQCKIGETSKLINKDFLKQVHRKINAKLYVPTTSCGHFQQ